MAYYPSTENFRAFFNNLNPSPTFERRAASEHATITGLIEDRNGLAAALSPHCFLQGSYKQNTAIYTINDVDIVALCALWHPAPAGEGQTWTRDEIFDTIAAPLVNDHRYRGKVKYGPTSMCVKVDLDIRVEILPVVFKQGNHDPEKEPFRLYRPETGKWEDGFARYHQGWLSHKNGTGKTNGNFIPAIKVLKHLRSKFRLDAVSFHIECLLFSFPDALFSGGPADYISAILNHIAATDATSWWYRRVMTPCGDRDIFTESEWGWMRWEAFHKAATVWAKAAALASIASDRAQAIELWQALLGKEFFPGYA